MTRPGIMVMLHSLSEDRETLETLGAAIGKKITDVTILADDDDIAPNELRVSFDDKTTIRIWDAGQNCCEHRYLHTDDDLTAFVDTTLIDVGILDGPTTQDEYGEPHEMQFFFVSTSLGVFTIETHNIHNGYYGGFAVRACLVTE